MVFRVFRGHQERLGSPASTSTPEIFTAFLRLGVTSFGGPVAHIGYFHDELVTRRRWIADTEFTDLVALCQFLPGPGSSQLAFAIGQRKAGLPGALAASVGFLLPSAAIMIGLAFGLAHAGSLAHVGWLQGLKVAAVAIVALAVLTMFRSVCTTPERTSIALGAALIVIVFNTTWGQLIALLAGAFVGARQLAAAGEPPPVPANLGPRRGSARAGGLALAAWLGLLALLPVAAHFLRSDTLAIFDRFYRAGSLVFGGGHVILPLLRAAVVPPGWISDNVFLAGYGAVQAMPGPLSSFAAYLGVAMAAGPRGVLGGLWALLAIYLPAWLVIGGALPLWDRLREIPRLRAAMLGMNAAVVGILIAALYTPVWTDGIQSPRQFGLGLIAFATLTLWRAPAWAVVIGCAAIGAVGL